ncbi:MAG: AsmA family protein [Bacteroidales bacterium]
MIRKLRNSLLLLLILLILPIAGLIILSAIHHRSAHDEFVDFLNNEFDGKVVFQDFSFSYFRHFPNAHLRLKGVSIRDGFSGVMKIGKLDITLNTMSLWQKKIKLKDITFHDAELSSLIDSLGNKSRILAGAGEKSDSIHKAMLIEADNIWVLNSKVYFENKVKNNRTGIFIREAWLDLETKDSLLIFRGKLDGKLDSLISNNTILFANQPVKAIDVVFTTNMVSGYKELKSGYMLAHTLKLMPKLTMIPMNDGQNIELHISGVDNFDATLDLFEFHTEVDLEQVNPNARLAISFNQKGFVNPYLRPYSELDFEIVNAEFIGSALPFPLQLDHLKGNYNNVEGHSPETVELVIDTIDAQVNESFVRGRLALYNLKDPFIDAHIISELDIGNLIKQNKNISLRGFIDLNVFLNGKISELRILHLEGKQQAIGQINVNNLELVLNEQGYSIELLNGASILNNHILEVTTLIGSFNKSAFHFQGHIENLDQYILNANENLISQFVLNIDELDLTNVNFNKLSENKADKPSLYPLSLMSLEFKVNAKKIITGSGEIENVALDCVLDDNHLKIGSLAFDYQKGNVSGTGDLVFGESGLLALNADVNGQFDQVDFDLPEGKQSQDNSNSKSFHVPANVNVKVDLTIKNGSIDQIPLRNMILQASMNGTEIKLNRFDVDVFDGHVSLFGRLELDSTGLNRIMMDADLNFNRLDIDNLLANVNGSKRSKSGEKSFQLPTQTDINIDLKASQIVYKDATLSNLTTQLKATDDLVDIRDFYADLPFGKISMDVTTKDYRHEHIKYFGSIDLLIDTLDLEKFLAMEAFGLPGQVDEKVSADKVTNKKQLAGLPGNLKFDVKAKAGQLGYKNVKIQDVNILVNYSNEKIDLEQLSFVFSGGSLNLHGYVNKEQTSSHPGYVYSKADSLDLSQLFSSFDNFSQDVFTGKNTSGKVSWTSHYYFDLGSDLIPKNRDNFWLLNFIINDTELQQVQPIENALFFVGHKSKDAMFIKELDINAVIDRNKLYFMDILMNNNIANLDVFGQVDLDRKTMDLGLEISLSDLFFRTKKNRMVQTQGGIVNLENDAKIFLNMSGPLTDHKLSMENKRKFNTSRRDLMDEIEKAEKEFRKKQKEHKNPL